MTYQVLARKWRPQDFSGVVGQAPVVTALQNALTEGRIAQAYLFSGIRGIGKTSVARILAKALNCEKGPAAEPCNDCVICREITQGSDLDVVEVDAATYSKVEQVRELAESLRYGPARDRYKVVVVDEIHRLSRQAFDALLKIVEEPPPHLVFVFATTEIEAVPATILSRCQEFRFRRVPSQSLGRHLAQIAEAEGIEASETAVRLIARAGDGSVRDAVALLDQLATYGSGSIPEDEAARILGGVDHALFHRLLEAILEGRGEDVAAVVFRVEEEGWDPRHVYTEFLGYCRDALHLALGLDQVDLPREEADDLARLAKVTGFENLLRTLNQLLGSEHAVRHSETGALALEIAWLRAAELPKLVAVEEVLSGLAGPPADEAPRRAAPRARQAGGEGAPKTAPRGRRAAPPRSEPPQPLLEPPAPVAEEGRSAAPRPTSETPAAADDEEIAAFLQHLSRRRQVLAAHLKEAQGLVFEDGRLQIYAPPRDPWLNLARLQRDSNRKALEEALATVWGADAEWKLIEREQAKSAPAGAEAEPSPGVEEAKEDPRVQAVLDIFGGAVESVIEKKPAGEGR